jgi:hypothetical protein
MKALFILGLLTFYVGAIAAVSHFDTLVARLGVSNRSAAQVATNEPSLQRRAAAPRPVFLAKANENLTLRWEVRANRDTALEDVLVHFYVARIEGSDPEGVPDLAKPENVVLEGALTMDFKEKNATQSKLTFRVSKPGRYLARVEAQHKDLSPSDEPSAVIELEVK